MTPAEIKDVKDRLTTHARTVQATAPDTILADDGGPSQALMDYREQHNLTLDWMVLGKEPQYRPQPVTLSDVSDSMIFLQALLQGLDILIGEAQESSKANNAVYALSQEVLKKCDSIMDEMHRIDIGASK